MTEFLHSKDAAALIGKSEVTLKRQLKKLDTSNDKSLKGQLIFKKKKVNNGYSWFIEKKSLIQHFNKKPIDQPTTNQRPVNDRSNVQLIDTLNNQVDHLKIELKEKNLQINELLQRVKELEILLLEEQRHRQRVLEHKPDLKTGVFSRALMKFGL